MAGTTGGQINVDTAYLKQFAKDIRSTEKLLRDAAKHADKARRHTHWKCDERNRVTDEVNSIKNKAERNASFLDALAKIIEQGAGGFENTQQQITSKLGSAEFTGK